MDVPFVLVMIAYSIVLGLLFVYGLNFLYFSFLTRKHHGPDPIAPPLEEYPMVTVQLPVYNERFVARRLIEAVAALDWPADRLEIQVLDDSTDDTVSIIAAAVQQQHATGVNIVHLHRVDRVGYKAGALAAGTEQAAGEFLAIFDADFLPPPDFLQNTIPHFADEKVGFVQTRWGHLNDDYSFFTRLQALSIDGHFMVEQFSRQRAGFLLNFNGTAGVWRRAAIDAAGGWKATTLTEDLDLSYRAQIVGWKGAYLRDVVTPAELPVTINAYRRQQYRWARGSMETAQLLIPLLLKARLKWRVKVQALLHLTGYGIHVLMFALSLLYPLVAILSQDYPQLVSLYGIAVLFNFTALAPTIYFTLAQIELKDQWWKRVPAILFLSVLGSGMMINNLQAIVHAFTRGEGVFERTPKFGIVGKQQQRGTDAYRLKISPRVLLEFGMLVFNLNTVRLAWQTEHYFTVFYAGLFAIGIAYLLTLTAWQTIVPVLGRVKLVKAEALEEPGGAL